MVDGVVLVVRAGRTSREAVLQAKKRLQLAGARLLGVVLNDRTYPLPEFLYRRL
jgi:protein-tyrosine kinase